MVIAGQCSLDGYFMKTSLEIAKLGATHIRAGVFKPRTSPYRFAGLGNANETSLDYCLELIKSVKAETGLKIVTEAMSAKQISLLYDHIDVFQIGSRNQCDSELLREFGRQDKPVILKRGMATTIEEFIMYADYISVEGNNNIILCERGIRTFETYTRNTFDIAAIPILKQKTNYKTIADASHGTGRSELVEPVTLASKVAGADGIMVEVHANPKLALTDGAQSLTVEQFKILMERYNKL